MADICINNLEDALRETGLSDEMLDEVMAQYYANKDTLFGMDDDALRSEIGTLLATVQKRAEQRRALQLEATKRITENAARINNYIDKGIDIEYWLTDIVDGNTLTGVQGGLRGYSTRLHSLTEHMQEKLLTKMDTDVEGKPLHMDAHGNAVPIYADMFRKKMQDPDPEFNRDLIKEIGYWQNKFMGDAKHREFDATMPEPGATNNDFAKNAARAIVEMQDENMAVLRGLGVDPGMIKDYYLPQKWFPEFLELSTWDKIKAWSFGIEREDGTIVKERQAVVEAERKKMNEVVDYICERLDEDVSKRNIRAYRYAKNKKAFSTMEAIANKAESKAPILSKRITELMNNPPKSERGITYGIKAILGDKYEELRLRENKTRHHETTLKAVLESNRFSAEEKAIAQELIDNPKLFDAVKNMGVPSSEDVDLRAFVREMCNNIIHPSTTGEVIALGANKAKELQQQRFLQFKDADAFFEIQERFGYANSAAHAMQHIQDMAKNQVQVELFAGNPHNVLTKMCHVAEQQLRKERDLLFRENGDANRIQILDKNIGKLRTIQKKAYAYADFISGVYNRRSDSATARIIDGAFYFGRYKLGLSGLAALGDAAIRTFRLAREWSGLKKYGIHIENIWSQELKVLGYMANMENWKNPDGSYMMDPKAHVHAMTGSLRGNMTRITPFGSREISDARTGDIFYKGRQAANLVQRKFMDLTGAQRMDDCSKLLVSDYLGTYLGNLATRDVPLNDPALKGVRSLLQMAEIGEEEWSLIKKRGLYNMSRDGSEKAISARELEKNLTARDIKNYLVEKHGFKPEEITNEDILVAKRDLVRRYDDMVVAYSNSAVVTPNLETRLALQAAGGDVDPTSYSGKFLQLFTEFASYPVRIAFDIHRSARIDGIKSNNMPMRVGTLIGNMYMFGYLTFALRSVMQGRTVPDPLDKDTIIKSLVAGGGLGYYGEAFMDVIGQENLADISTFVGPTGSTILGAGNLALKGTHGTVTNQQVADYMYRQVPNLIGFKLVFDKACAEAIYRWFGADYKGSERLRKWEEKYGTLKDSPLFDQFKKLW